MLVSVRIASPLLPLFVTLLYKPEYSIYLIFLYSFRQFFCFLLIVLVAEIATGVYAYLNQDQLMKIIRTNVKHTIQNEYGTNENELPTEVFNTFQKHVSYFEKKETIVFILNCDQIELMQFIEFIQLECCGIDGPLDWQTSKYNNNTKAINLDVSSPEALFIIPESCCKENVTVDVCKQATRIKVGTTQIDQLPSAKYIHQKVKSTIFDSLKSIQYQLNIDFKLTEINRMKLISLTGMLGTIDTTS